MTITVDRIFEEALGLSDESRVVLAERLIESVEPDPAILTAQLAVAARRAEELESGAVKGIPGDEALRQVRESILALSRA